MNETPSPAPVAEQVPPAPTPAQKPSSLATTSMILGIVAFALGIIFFISIPAAIIALITGIIALKMHYPGKGKAIAGIVTGGLVLLFIPLSTVLAFISFAEKDFDYMKVLTGKSMSSYLSDRGVETEKPSTSTPIASGSSVKTDCYSYTIPAEYLYDDRSTGCTTVINIDGGDTLTRITVKPNTGTIGSLKDVVAKLDASLKKSDPKSEGVVTSEEFTSNGQTIYFIGYKDAYNLSFGNYIIPVESSGQTIGGEVVTAYSVIGYTVPALKEVANSLIIK